ncbi:IMP cyclohydrolase [Mucisphaera calidilacus]|uniref:Bifunctional purine biosynthesis protein PurH n=1 Tax=Mucisphaera calidilacus TaxID=2527982 RepID=A0A518BXV4_9BACT|nr:IMP cyclohydrolase [Mucisphaera calidilacus]QDU71786.1 Bifunctional purine biosynthesis protein PurH [Mucisphaera calidilacus]
MTALIKAQTALLSVSDKTDLIPFARQLVAHDIKLLSTGGTAKALAEAGLDVTLVEKITGFPEMMGGRVKTLHPNVHGGLLALRDNPEHVEAMNQHGIQPIDMVVINLYPFEKTIADPACTRMNGIEQIDIGGPSMIRSAAKNHPFVVCVSSPAQYDPVATQLNAHEGATTLALRQELAAAAFARTSAYDNAIASWLAG